MTKDQLSTNSDTPPEPAQEKIKAKTEIQTQEKPQTPQQSRTTQNPSNAQNSSTTPQPHPQQQAPTEEQTHTETPTRDEKWFEQLFRQNIDKIVKYLARRGAYDEAEDLAAEVFALAWRKKEDIPVDKELPWLYTTASMTLNNFYRKKKALPMGEGQDFLHSPDLTDPSKLVIEDLLMRQAMASLSERDREILLASAWDGLVGQSLADYLKVSRSAADAALSRARARLNEAVKKFS